MMHYRDIGGPHCVVVNIVYSLRSTTHSFFDQFQSLWYTSAVASYALRIAPQEVAIDDFRDH